MSYQWLEVWAGRPESVVKAAKREEALRTCCVARPGDLLMTCNGLAVCLAETHTIRLSIAGC